MKYSKSDIKKLLQTLAKTKERELNCDECLQVVAEFAEKKFAGEEIPASLLLVEQHLSICDECKEEFETLLEVLQAESGN